MSFQEEDEDEDKDKDVSTLRQLALQGALTDEDLVISVLEYLPIKLFPLLFEEAFIKRQTKVVKAMVVCWPFRSLPLGALIEYIQIDNFQAVLDGMDWLSNQDVWPSEESSDVTAPWLLIGSEESSDVTAPWLLIGSEESSDVTAPWLLIGSEESSDVSSTVASDWQ
ncbi:hypothetical protein STEG23_009079 [Scotinomys teguina]